MKAAPFVSAVSWASGLLCMVCWVHVFWAFFTVAPVSWAAVVGLPLSALVFMHGQTRTALHVPDDWREPRTW